jgi:hypothetical protein
VFDHFGYAEFRRHAARSSEWNSFQLLKLALNLFPPTDLESVADLTTDRLFRFLQNFVSFRQACVAQPDEKKGQFHPSQNDLPIQCSANFNLAMVLVCCLQPLVVFIT